MSSPMGFHINRDGVAGRCRAKIKCPFMPRDEHYSTLEDARNAASSKVSSKKPFIINLDQARVAKSVRGIKTNGSGTFLSVSEVDLIDSPKITEEPAVAKLLRENGLPFGS